LLLNKKIEEFNIRIKLLHRKAFRNVRHKIEETSTRFKKFKLKLHNQIMMKI